MQQEKNHFLVFFINMYFCEVMFNKTIFSFPRKLLNGLKSVFAKHPLR